MMMIDSKEKAKQPILVHDVIRSILERLSFVDFYRARCVSSAWYSASKSSCMGGTNPTTPWIILFPNGSNSCKLYDPRDHNSYTVRDHLGFDFASSRCLASSGSWFLMLNHGTVFYLLNLFTRQRIPLPSLESIDGSDVRLIGSAVLWVDEESRDYLVVWSTFASLFAYHKKGDNNNNNESWKVLKHFKNQGGCIDMVFKQGKLYLLDTDRNVTVIDISDGDSPMECASFPPPLWFGLEFPNNLAVTLSGEVLIISSLVEPSPGIFFFCVYKLDPKSSAWTFIKSIGDQVLLLDLGITVEAKDEVMKNCIYFGNDQFGRRGGISLCNDDNRIGVYHIKTGKVVQVFDHLTASSPIHFKDARWFFPTFGSKWLH